MENAIFNCRHATYLIEKKSIDKISRSQNVQLYLHLMLCAVCRMDRKQSTVISRMIENLIGEMNRTSASGIDEKIKISMQQDINRKLDLNKNQ